MDIIFYPPYSDSNDYINLFVNSLESNGCRVINKAWNGDIKLILYSMLKVISHKNVIFHFNWLEDNAARKGLLARIKCELLLIFFKIFGLCGGKLVWTMHNARSHNEDNRYQEYFIKRMLKYISLVVVHCSESIEILQLNYGYSEKKILFVPHGNYCSVIKQYPSEKNKNYNKFRILYFGSISYYKGVEKLIKAFNCDFLNENAELVICGKVNDTLLEDRIRLCARQNVNIKLDLRYISNEELGAYISSCDAIVLPYEKESMQNSGSAILAISCGKPIIIPVFGYIKDILDKDFVFSYDYSDESDQIIKLRMKMQEICSIYINNPKIIYNAGCNAKLFAERELDWDTIVKRIIEYYKC